MIGRLRDLLVDGLLLALPLAVVFVLLQKVIAAITKLLAPAQRLLPDASWFGLGVVDLLAVAVLVLGLVVIGAFARSGTGRRLSAWIERIVLRKIPGFLLYKSIVSGFSTEERDAGVIPALVAFDDNVVLGFIVEQADPVDGMVTVFVPAAPTPAAGNVLLVERSRVTPLDIPVSAALHTVTRLGLGLQALTQAGRSAAGRPTESP
ncbi:DUF502 domain-containing protein [Piscinibacter gummiphilus]|uniref:Uncharacterized protein n=1 Tax=Piscinibacter gummiphilus TaxID=946333 RepID=A0A1W6L339_9BURK|nr:DUF502 domain-containing protein [Piscinibacter gummiphilus]ARN18684.1 hypothetical protein A4W93_01420 [Piscinibacter gummiphilus]ATU63317.1 DUF502 domain-containing protein [Piscinibacter gummiphilus]GLS95655.1 hypothetical protein GCM10007918_29470 [Piscinibacter gummiphilus]